ncbi:cupin domain-containing protein [Bacillus sp. 165]|uniref:cupin domain-containing protein n=1 Tax=Bacillus sp. 165 TaxID=1529117 RepID=UPI001AD9DA4C|nr:cupin domain-containing protein [Bacillus sp. 165]MBO9129280.1 cupin domain-containing protein [Bacillus sp. 165]
MTQNSNTVIHKFTGETITFLKKTNQELLIEVILPPNTIGPPLHFHDRFTEQFTVIKGELTVIHNKERHILIPGETIFVPLKEAHTFRNESHEPVRFTVKLTPGEGFEESVRIHYGLMEDGLTNDKGNPKNLFYTLYILYLQNTLVSGIPIWIQRVLFTIIPIGKRIGTYQSLNKYIRK